jgi:hypothetical protein
MSNSRRSPLLVLVAGAALSLVLVGCGSGGGYKKPNQPGTNPPMYPPGGAASINSPNSPKAADATQIHVAPGGNPAAPSRVGR